MVGTTTSGTLVIMKCCGCPTQGGLGERRSGGDHYFRDSIVEYKVLWVLYLGDCRGLSQGVLVSRSGVGFEVVWYTEFRWRSVR